MYNKIKELIILKCPNIDSKRLIYFTNYFFTLVTKKVIPKNILLEDLIDNALENVSKIVFYDEDHSKYKELGPNVKGLYDSKDKIIYVRSSLDEDLCEITIYHELHHAVQTNLDNLQVGINQKDNFGRMIMEAQTQYFAELVYCMMHQIKFEEKHINTENLRMLEGGTIVSCLHNYEMYDAMLSKLAILLGVDKDYFVSINFLYKNDEGLKDLEKRYNEVRSKYGISLSFIGIMQILDYIYVVDYIAYKDNPDKEVILGRKETKDAYIIHHDFCKRLSLVEQFNYINTFDVEIMFALLNSGELYLEFAKYVISNKNREILNDYIENKKK